jgi:hypothetical protein
MKNEFPLCRECQAEGLITFATFVHPAADEDLDGPAMGDPDFWPEPFQEPAALCGAHYARLPADSRLAYVPLPFCAA